MKKFLVITSILSLLLGSNAFAASQTTLEDKTVKAIQEAAMKDNWTQYRPSAHHGAQTLYFKKKIKNRDYYNYRYQARKQNEKTTVYVKVDYGQNGINVDFTNKVRMNPGSLGINNRVHNVLDEFSDAIELALESNA